MFQKLFVFDLDDTLINNVHDYADPILDSCRVIIRELGTKAPHVSKIVALEQEIDQRRVHETNPADGKPYLYSMERFPGSLVETYLDICETTKVKPSPDVEKEIYAIGLTAFDETKYLRNVNPNAKKVLDFLWWKRAVLCLLSKGDKRVQEKKLEALNRAGINYFAVEEVVEDKTSDIFAKIAEMFPSFGPRYSVGNSYSSDIAPALDAGFNGIYLPVETWETIGRMDRILNEVDRTRCLVLSNLGELVDHYDKLP